MLPCNSLVEECAKTGIDITVVTPETNQPSIDVELLSAAKKTGLDFMMPYQVNSELLEETEALVLHDLPTHRGYEITDSVLEGPRCVAFRQAEKRMRAEKALMLELVSS